MRTWATAWQRALYGEHGFYTVGPGARTGPGAHFRTSVHVGPVFAAAVAGLLAEVDTRLGHPARLDLVDVGAGRGELAAGVLAVAPAALANRLRVVTVEVRDRPPHLDPRITWRRAGTRPLGDLFPAGVRGLLVAHELLDDVPCEVVEVGPDGERRLVLVDDTGAEHPGPPLTDREACTVLGVDAAVCQAWLERWWPIRVPGARAEVGVARDATWAAIAGTVRGGTALAVDYGHDLAERRTGRHDRGTLVGYAHGRVVAAVPDGRCDLTAHVAMDSCAAAVPGAVLVRQRDALAQLGVSARLPPRSLAADPVAYADALQAASDAAELRDPHGLGAFWWLRHDVG